MSTYPGDQSGKVQAGLSVAAANTLHRCADGRHTAIVSDTVRAAGSLQRPLDEVRGADQHRRVQCKAFA